MNEKGNILIFGLLLFLVVAILPAIAMMVSPIAKIIIQVILFLSIYMLVRSYMGSGVLTLIVTGVMGYILVIKYPEFTAGIWILSIIVMLGAGGVIIWGLSLFRR